MRGADAGELYDPAPAERAAGLEPQGAVDAKAGLEQERNTELRLMTKLL